VFLVVAATCCAFHGAPQRSGIAPMPRNRVQQGPRSIVKAATPRALDVDQAPAAVRPPDWPHAANERGREITMYKRILVPVDGSRNSDEGLIEAIAVARLTGAIVRVVHVIAQPVAALAVDGFTNEVDQVYDVIHERGAKIVADALERVRAAGLEADELVLESYSAQVHALVVQAAVNWRADLIVIGTHGRHGIGRLLMGSDAEEILRSSSCPVLVVRRDAS
jgi:nucleotide-binding universal stress UspA family protein